MKKLYVTGLTILLSAMFVIPAHAQQPPEIYLSEINWAGSTLSTADEWIELFNPNGESVDVSGWILTGSATSRNALAIADGTVIEANSTLLIANYDLGHEKTTLDVQPDLVTSSLSLANSDLDILLTTREGIVVDEVHISGRPDVGSTEPHTSMRRDFELDIWQSSVLSINLLDGEQLGTPGVVTNEDGTDLVPDEEVDEVNSSEDSQEVTEVSEEVIEPPAGMCWCPCQEVTDEPVEDDEADVGADFSLPDDELDDSPPNTEETINEPIEEPDDENPIIDDLSSEASAQGETTSPMSYIYHALLINEFVSDPEDTTEWIEIFNPGSTDIELEGWTVADETERATELVGTIDAGGFAIIENPSGRLNNAGDSIYLFDPTGNKIDEVTYGDELASPEKGESLARDEHLEWHVTTLITKNAPNKFNQAYEEQTSSEEDADGEQTNSSDDSSEVTTTTAYDPTSSGGNSSDVPDENEPFRVVAIAHAAEVEEDPPATAIKTADDSKMTVRGALTAAPDTFGPQIAYIPGTQLYFYYADWPNLNVGDIVEVTGEQSESRGETRLKISSADDIEILGQSTLTPTHILATNIENTPNGTLVTITGNVMERDGDKLVVKDDSGEVTIVANTKTSMSWSSVNSLEVSITGIVRHVNGNARLYPRTMADVEERIVSQVNESGAAASVIAEKADWKPWAGGGLIASASVAIAFWYIRSKQLDLLPQTT